ncbi:putative membrane protein, putative toxin regulator [Halobacteroides halobius DSM 5150]|uniref:Putative membrane protein, putative toxin regulator n=1 Tax=Halobacteroides halobius (strain ATCC 35273 / DSM 5150 / MD-1) TaxID=748449 RepID=L0K737_HALHC|nr:PTS sugar transporter subunit IIC [Halobacteroides halobius]AGB41102.1 putative membrane protein, putative toxin regulator [Halobacteroides halobius DSM 5150]
MAAVKEFLANKNIKLSLERYGIQALGAMAKGLFASLIVGLILKVLGQRLDIPLLVDFSKTAMDMMGPAIGVAVAYGLKAPPLVIFTSVVTGAAGAQLGGPVGAFLAAVIGTECGKLISKETKLDIVLTPSVVIITGLLMAKFVGPGIDQFMKSLGQLIMTATRLQPIPMGILVATLMGMALTLPISSAAIGLMLSLSGLAAGAATVGCSAQMIGFAVMSYRENGFGGLISQGLGTSMLQVPNIIKNPYIWVPPTLSGAILGPIATTIIPLKNIPIGSGMGTAGLVGQFGTIEAMGMGALGPVILLHFILPALLTLIIAKLMRKQGLIKERDLKLNL